MSLLRWHCWVKGVKGVQDLSPSLAGRVQCPPWKLRSEFIDTWSAGGSQSWQLLRTPAGLQCSLLRPNFPWDVQEESPKARGGSRGRVGTARGAGAAQLQHSWLSILGSAAANVEVNGFSLGSSCSTALINEHPIFPKWREPILEVSVHLLMALL